MPRNIPHPLLTDPSPDVRARQRFIMQFKREVERLRRRVRDSESAPVASSDSEAIGKLYEDPAYRAICALKLNGQERMWRTVEDAFEGERERISTLYSELANSPDRRGQLKLDPNLDVGDRWRRSRVHLQPGGYHAERRPNDLMAGALYEEGGALYSRGQSVGEGESKAECAIRFIREWKPGFEPQRILDMACSAGASAIPYAIAFPDAEVHAIDLSAPMLRYAHGKAESVGARVFFHQMDATQAGFEDGSFDLVVSHNALHEMAEETRAAVFKESFRLLRPGGLVVHQDVPLRANQLNPTQKAELLYDHWFNGELYWAGYLESDCEAYLDDAGFSGADRRCELFQQLDNTMSWYFAAAQKPSEAVR